MRPNESGRFPAVLVLLGVALAAPLVVYTGTARSVVAVWNSSNTFAHGYAIVPVTLWLIWQRRRQLEALPVAPFWPALLLLALLGSAWFAADLADVQVARQYALAAMLPVTVLAVLGKAVARALAFPLAFIMLAVPFGDALIPPLIDLTADFTVNALVATGIPVLREGTQFTIPSGRWSVVEACSGVRYLIASISLGFLFAHLNYRSRVRQAVFVLLSAVVPIVANVVRAYGIVMIGHLSGNTLAVGIDHFIYGWIFFGIVMFLLFWIGSFWREGTAAPNAAAAETPAPGARRLAPAAVALAAALIAVAAPPLAFDAALADASVRAADLGRLSLAWQETDSVTAWRPAYSTASAQLHRSYRAGPQHAGLSVLYYQDQRRAGVKLISSVNRLADPNAGWWQLSQVAHVEQFGPRILELREAVLSDGSQKLLVWSWYWIAGQTTASDYAGKVYQARALLTSGRDDGAALLAYARFDEDPEQARATLRAFVDANLAPIEAALSATLEE
ncbi:MAG TPA: exosortase A [Telluria sp.]